MLEIEIHADAVSHFWHFAFHCVLHTRRIHIHSSSGFQHFIDSHTYISSIELTLVKYGRKSPFGTIFFLRFMNDSKYEFKESWDILEGNMKRKCINIIR